MTVAASNWDGFTIRENPFDCNFVATYDSSGGAYKQALEPSGTDYVAIPSLTPAQAVWVPFNKIPTHWTAIDAMWKSFTLDRNTRAGTLHTVIDFLRRVKKFSYAGSLMQFDSANYNTDFEAWYNHGHPAGTEPKISDYYSVLPVSGSFDYSVGTETVPKITIPISQIPDQANGFRFSINFDGSWAINPPKSMKDDSDLGGAVEFGSTAWVYDPFAEKFYVLITGTFDWDKASGLWHNQRGSYPGVYLGTVSTGHTQVGSLKFLGQSFPMVTDDSATPQLGDFTITIDEHW